jgi:hypothetical protein
LLIVVVLTDCPGSLPSATDAQRITLNVPAKTVFRASNVDISTQSRPSAYINAGREHLPTLLSSVPVGLLRQFSPRKKAGGLTKSLGGLPKSGNLMCDAWSGSDIIPEISRHEANEYHAERDTMHISESKTAGE